MADLNKRQVIGWTEASAGVKDGGSKETKLVRSEERGNETRKKIKDNKSNDDKERIDKKRRQSGTRRPRSRRSPAVKEGSQ